MRAIISVSDKNQVDVLAKGLVTMDWEIISTGGTARFLREKSVPVTDVSAVTHFPECLDGRVKTLHPGVLAGVLATKSQKHVDTMTELNLSYVDMVVVNLYPFEETIAKPDVTWDDAIENIDIGGPTMIRAAAKNHDRMIVVVDPSDYGSILEQLHTHGEIDPAFSAELALKVFQMTSHYDQAIAKYMAEVMVARRAQS